MNLKELGVRIFGLIMIVSAAIIYGTTSSELNDDAYVRLWNRVTDECPNVKYKLKTANSDGKITIGERNALYRACNEEKIKKLKQAIENI